MMKNILIFYLALSIFITCHTASAQQLNEFRGQQCLNGWWDFNPVYVNGRQHNQPGEIPSSGWKEKAMIVPGSWKRGSSELNPGPEFWNEWRISDSYGMPAAWDSTNTAWYRRSFQLGEVRKDRSYFLRFDGILRESWIFVNGKETGHRKEGTLPSEHDISDAVRPGLNEIVVFVTDYKRDENNRTFVQVGADQMGCMMGIWGDVFLEERPLVRVNDVAIRTSTRKNEITVIYTIRNKGKKTVTLNPEFSISTYNKVHHSFTDETVTINPGEAKEIRRTEKWSGYIPWSPENPQLYYLNVGLKENNRYIDTYSERFGFREIWIEGHNIILNGKPVHLLGEWGHKDHAGFFRPEYVRQWFGMLKDLNMNYIRTHTFPHPQFLIDLADEMGIMVCLESSWFMSGSQAMDKPEFWENAKDHARDNVKYYKNHPSVIFWSTGNEVRWGWNINEVIKHGPEIQKIYEDNDPTRITYSDGSTSLWDERTQKIISRHYGLECTGEEFWDKSKPLHVGEFGKWHYGQPIDNLVWGNDEIFSSFRKCAVAIAEEAADIIEQGRSNEVACFFPWNLSCLDNYRTSSSEIRHEWGDFSTPYAKPLRTAPYGSEFAWWEPQSKGYLPGAGFNIIKNANRPFEIYVRERLNQTYDDQNITHTVTLINDTGKDINGILKINTFLAGNMISEQSHSVTVKTGETFRKTFIIPAQKKVGTSELLISSVFHQGSTVVDSVSRKIGIIPSGEKNRQWKVNSCLVYGPGSMKNILASHGVSFRYVKDLDTILRQKVNLLIVEKNSLQAGTTQNRILNEFIVKGGRVFIMEQENCALPELSIQSKPSERCFIRAYDHPLMNQFSDNDFNYWGNDPYGKSNSDSWVVVKPYLKPSSGNTTILLDSGFGDFGSGGLNWTPLFETRTGNGIAVVSQLRLCDKMDTHPVAGRMVQLVLSYLSSWSPAMVSDNITITDSDDVKAVEKLGVTPGKDENTRVILASGKNLLDNAISQKLYNKVINGSTVIIHNLDSAMLVKIANEWNTDIKPVNLGPQYNLIRNTRTGLLNGISNQETYWLDKAHYTPTTNQNRKMCDWLMSSSSGISLLESESESCWREFYTLGANSEWLRMPVVTHLLHNGPRLHASGMMSFELGKGKLIITQIPLPSDNYPKAMIYWAQLLANLNVRFSHSLFDGDKVVFGSQKSNGYPESLRIITNPGKELIDNIISKGDPGETSERFSNQGLAEGFRWEKTKTAGGELTLPDDCKEVIIFYELRPGRPRKLKEVTGGLPDPTQQTFLDFSGKGKITLFVNGKEYRTVDPEGGKSNVPDIDLNQFSNTILIRFIPESKNLKMIWRDRQNRPEVEFEFN